MVLRIHRGRQSTIQSSANSTNGSTYLNNGSGGGGAAGGAPATGTSKKGRLKSSSSYTSTENVGDGSTLSHSHSLCDTREFSRTPRTPTITTSVGAAAGERETDFGDKSLRSDSQTNINAATDDEGGNSGTCHENSSKSKDGPATKRNAKLQAKRFRMETKAAKTLAIIVGGFIVCWLPFFTVYLLRPFCTGCTPDIVFSVLFWLGYCNSAINPVIYALFSRDFRNAFQQIIIRVCCSSYFAANRAYFSPNKRPGKRPPFPFPHPFMSGGAAPQATPPPPSHSASSSNLGHLSNSERFR